MGAERAIVFDDAQAYERFMGRWSRAAGAEFLAWVAPPQGAHWLEVGCGTGAFTELVLEAYAPATLIATDSMPTQIEYARSRRASRRADFQVADVQTLQFSDSTFDVIAAALVINFIADRDRALSEMRRVGRPGGIVAGYVWDFAGVGAPNSHLMSGLAQIGSDTPTMPGAEASSLDSLTLLFGRAGLEQIAARSIDVTITFPDFDHFWCEQTPSFSPLTSIIAALPVADQVRLMVSVREQLRPGSDGTITCSARANAIQARIPE
jgi:ubiquinone/menaquinone biosynthesis C-methylase UbiE